MSLCVVPISFAEANAFVAQHHRPVAGCKFCVATAYSGTGEPRIAGVALVGRPVARSLDDGFTLEVNRLCTDGHKNACSMLYAATWRAARALGYRKLITYTLPEEGGSSLRAAGWRLIGAAGGGTWHCPSRPRVDAHPTQQKLRWEAS